MLPIVGLLDEVLVVVHDNTGKLDQPADEQSQKRRNDGEHAVMIGKRTTLPEGHVPVKGRAE
jgi:hypothetical protein